MVVRGIRRTLVAAAVALASFAGIHTPRPPEVYRGPGTYDFSNHADLLTRLRATPYGYFRFISRPFTRAICKRFPGAAERYEVVNLHGNAHLEQYAVTPHGGGLTDFDDTAAGPAVVDLIRFGAALKLAASQRGWDSEADQLFIDFITAYRTALANPDARVPVPSFVRKTQAGFKGDRSLFLLWADSIMEPVADESADWDDFESGYQRYVKQMLSHNKELKAPFFTMKKVGRLKTGIGSALDKKFLVRIEGPTRSPEDDEILEAKEVRSLRGIPCLRSPTADQLRVVAGKSRMSIIPDRFVAHVPAAESATPFWVQSWVVDYEQIDVMDSLGSVEELREVVVDIGTQLARSHVREVPEIRKGALREAQLAMLSELGPELWPTVKELTDQTLAAWQLFKEKTERPGT